MIIGNNQKLFVVLADNDAGTAARNLYGLARSKPGLLLHNHGVVNGNNGRHSLLYNRRNIGLDCGSNRCTGGRAATVI